MKGGSRAQARSGRGSADDWGDESWTVDCPCGVNFDDGEEMVDCDECGVWVHTACCRVLKGHTSYVCDKCRSKKKSESEETEVAQLLLDLPSKALALEERSSEKVELCSMPLRSPGERSMEERAHVQGIPGGDATVTLGVSTVFSRQLWKCTGYIPKMLRFTYNELPEWPGERLTACAFSTQTGGRQTHCPASDGLTNAVASKAEDDRRLGADAEDQHAPKEKRGKRESKKAESKHGRHRHRPHGLEEERGHYQSKRRKEERSQNDSAGKKRVRNHPDGSKHTEGSRKKTAPAQEGNTAGDISCTGLEVSRNRNSSRLPDLLRNENLKEQYDGNEERQVEFISLPSTPALDSRSTEQAGFDHEETKYQDCKFGLEFQTPLKQIEIMNTAVRKCHTMPGIGGVAVDIGAEVHKTVTDKEQVESGVKCITTATPSELNKQAYLTTREQLERGVEVGKLFQLQDFELSGMPDVLSSVAWATSAVESNVAQAVTMKQQKTGMTVTPPCSSPCQSNLVYDNESPSEAWKSLPKQFLSLPGQLLFASQFSNSPDIRPVKYLGSRSGRTGSRSVKVEAGCEQANGKNLDKSSDYLRNSKSEKFGAHDARTNKSLSSLGSSGSLVQGSSNNFGSSSPQKSEPQFAVGLGSQAQAIVIGSASFQLEHSLLSLQQSTAITNKNTSVLSGKENTCPEKQEPIGQKDLVSMSAHSSGKCIELSQVEPALSAHQRHHTISETAHTFTEEKRNDKQLLQDHVEELAFKKSGKTEEQLCSWASRQYQEDMPKTKGQDQRSSSSPSPSCQHAFQQYDTPKLHANVSLSSTVASGKIQITEGESPNVSSFLPSQIVPLRPSCHVKSSLPPSSSCLGFASKSQQTFIKSGSGSPSFEKSGSVGLGNLCQLSVASKSTSRPSTSSLDKPTALEQSTSSNDRVLCSSGTKYPLIISGTAASLSDSKPMSNNNMSEIIKVDSDHTLIKSVAGGVVGGLTWHSPEVGVLSSKHCMEELARNLENAVNKVTGLGKCSSMPVISNYLIHPKGHHSSLSLNHSNQAASKQESSLGATIPEQVALPQPCQPSLQTRQGLSNTSVRCEKMGSPSAQMGSKSTSVEPLSHLAAMSEKQGSMAMAPILNDEELALLLHQELNSSPRVPRVARFRQHVTTCQLISSSQTVSNSNKQPSGVTALPVPEPTQKENHLGSRKRVRDDSLRESSHGSLIGAEDPRKGDTWPNKKCEDTMGGTGALSDGCTVQKLITMSNTMEATSHHSPLLAIPECLSASDMSDANESPNVGEGKSSADNIVTLPGLIEEILNEKGNQASYDYICEAVSPHWPKLRKQNGERYAYTSHRQAVLDCLRNRSAWSHLIDRGPKTNIGRKRQRHESVAAVESENEDDGDTGTCIQDDEADDYKLGKSSKNPGPDRSKHWASDKVMTIDAALLEEVPKGKRKARRRRRPASQGRGDRSVHRKDVNKHKEIAEAMHNAYQEATMSPLSEEDGSNDSEEEVELVHRELCHSRRQGSSVDSGDDID